MDLIAGWKGWVSGKEGESECDGSVREVRVRWNDVREISATLPMQILFKIKTNTFEYLSVMEV